MSDKGHILYMEDDEGIRRLLQKRLRQVGYEVDLAPNGEVGIELSSQHIYDAIIVDYNMPDLNGIQVIQHLVKNDEIPPIIMLTGTGNEKIAVEAIKLGAFDYVIKDIDAIYLDLLPTVIEQGLQHRRLLKDKRLAEEKLERSEKYYRALIENSPDLIILADQAGFIRYVSPTIQDMFGLDERELVGRNGLALVTDRQSTFLDQPPFADLLNFYQSLLQSSNQRLAIECRVLGRDGLWKWLEIRGNCLLHEPWIEAVVFNIRDITERKQAEEALRESEERFRMLFELAPDPYFINDLKGNLIDVNQAVEPLLGFRKSDLVGKNFVEMGVLDQGEIDRVSQMLGEFTLESSLNPPELTVKRRDGEKIIIDLRMIPIQSKNETQILGIGHDVTWRKLAETQMKDHIRQLETLRQIDDVLTRKLDIYYVQVMALDHMMMLSRANAGCILLMQDQVTSHFYSRGYAEELNPHDVLEKSPIVARVAQRRAAEWIQDVRSDPDYLALQTDTCSQMVFPLMSQQLLVGIVNLETNQPDNFHDALFEFLKLIPARIAVAIDNARLYESQQKQLIELQSLYRRITQLEQLKTDMIRLAAHDLRNPLANILIKTYMLRRSASDDLPCDQANHLDDIDTAVNRMQTMISEFLSLERIEEITENRIVRQKIDLNDLVRTASGTFLTQALEKSQALHVSVPETPIIVMGLKAELQQVIVNLIGNAVKYTGDAGTIRVILQVRDGLARFEVTDTGCGIAAEQQEKLFQPFYRVQSPETRSIEGTGLGLYLVKRIIERNHGEVIFASEYGKGSTFGFTLPLAQE